MRTWALAWLVVCLPVARAMPVEKKLPERPRWMLSGLMQLSQTRPHHLVRIAQKLFAPERLRLTMRDPQYAFDWQTRLAMTSALSDVFDPERSRVLGASAAEVRKQARLLLQHEMADDPSLLVRDGAVESVRRILRMSPQENLFWKAPLEKAFLDARNHIDGEGLFIRETILTALREGSLTLSKQVRRAAERDSNPQVKALLRNWNTAAYDRAF